MGFLTPLYMFGFAALTLPILFHLIRRTPRGRQVFSSLMFLSPSPPRLTRRSRIEQWLLMLLRAAALALLALAFARPFLRQAANLSLDGIRGRRVAILLDTSASMQRAGLWPQAVAKVEQLLARLDPADQVALFTFNHQMTVEVPFEQQANAHPKAAAEMVRERMATLAPQWGDTDLGNALASVADMMTFESDSDRLPTAMQIVLVSDLQKGSSLKRLQDNEWPQQILLVIDAIEPADPSNASLRVLANQEETDPNDSLRVRVANAGDSQREQFSIRWSNQPADENAVPLYVPAGQSRVARIKGPAAEHPGNQLLLEGDKEPFDNSFYIVPPQQERIELQYVGTDEADDPDGLLYYLGLALDDTPRRQVNITAQPPEELKIASGDLAPRLIVVTSAVSTDGFAKLDQYLRAGGFVLAVTSNSESAVALASYQQQLKYVPSTPAARKQDYLLLSDIDFGHPLFATFASPRYSDFTKIHFWQHQRFRVDDPQAVQVIARFDNGDPALWEQAVDAGKLIVLASGWDPEDSQLALSTKFVPLLNTLLDQAAGGPITMPSFTVLDPVPLPGKQLAGTARVTNPDGATIELAASDDTFRAADRPGIYLAARGGREFQFAVNVASSESDTARMDIEQLEQLGVPPGEHRSRSEEAEHQRQLRDIELEAQQKMWHWLIIAVLGVLGFETWLAGRRGRAILKSDHGDQG